MAYVLANSPMGFSWVSDYVVVLFQFMDGDISGQTADVTALEIVRMTHDSWAARD